MRLYFRSEYGPGRLNYPLFGEGDLDSFDRLVVRGGFNDSWLVDSGSQREDIQHMRDQFVRDTFAEMGHVAAEGRYVHLYLNGLYWGLYNITERMDSEFHADHFGGNPDDYDVINHGGVVDGNDTSWSNLLSLVDADMSVDANYQAVIQELDVDSLIDYMMVNIYSGTMDWPGNNWMAAANRVTGEGFRFFVWDAERSLEGLNDDRTNVSSGGTIAELYAKLKVNVDFQRRFADRVQMHMFNDGALTPAATDARFRDLADGIRDAVIAESARWGDVRYSTPATVDGQWQTNYDWRVDTYFPQRTDVVLNQLTNDNLASSVAAPTFSQLDGEVPLGFELSLTAPTGVIYYTLDGTDPLLPNEPGSQSSVTLFDETAAKRVLVTDTFVSDAWRGGSTFDDSAWISGSGGVGYDEAATYVPFIDFDVDSQMNDENASALIRTAFTVDADDLASINSLRLRMRYDDGFVAYLNGVEIEAMNDPAVLTTTSSATSAHTDSVAVNYVEFDVSGHLSDLIAGDNILAIHGLNFGTGSSDFLIDVELIGGTGTPGGVSPSAVLYAGPITLNEDTTVRARTLDGTDWSAQVQGDFIVGAAVADASNLRVTEVHYNPAAPSAAEILAGYTDNDEFEFIELQNVSSGEIELAGIRFINDIDLTVGPSTRLSPGEFALIVENQGAFAERYGVGLNVIGQYTGALSNGGETITLIDAADVTIQQFTYEDGDDPGEEAWTTMADGNGPSLVVIDSDGDYNDGANWQASTNTHGTPGAAETTIPGDFDGNGDVDGNDLGIWETSYATTSNATSSDGDTDSDGDVDGFDFLAWQRNFSGVTAVAASASSLISAEVNSNTNEFSSGGDLPAGASVFAKANLWEELWQRRQLEHVGAAMWDWLYLQGDEEDLTEVHWTREFAYGGRVTDRTETNELVDLILVDWDPRALPFEADMDNNEVVDEEVFATLVDHLGTSATNCMKGDAWPSGKGSS
jgi:hypothetical protein